MIAFISTYEKPEQPENLEKPKQPVISSEIMLTNTKIYQPLKRKEDVHIMKYTKLLRSCLAALCFCGVAQMAAAYSPWEENYTQVQLDTTKKEGTLIFSDCPEYAQQPGILYEGTVKKGKGRIYYYHVNEIGSPARVLVYAQSDKKQDISVTRAIKGDASSDYYPTGSTLSYREIMEPKQDVQNVTLGAHKRTVIWDDDEMGIREEDLVSGIVEVETKNPVSFGVAILPHDNGSALQQSLDQAVYLPPDSHEMRGTFASDVYMENKNTWDFAKGTAMLKLGGDDSSLQFQKGPDEISHVERENTGDYGIAYHIIFHSKGSGKYKLYLNGLGGYYFGSFEVGQNPKLMRVYRTDVSRLKKFGGDFDTWQEAGSWDAGKDLYIRLMPPGAACMPLVFMMVPEKQ